MASLRLLQLAGSGLSSCSGRIQFPVALLSGNSHELIGANLGGAALSHECHPTVNSRRL
jgi:hypothetical protein